MLCTAVTAAVLQSPVSTLVGSTDLVLVLELGREVLSYDILEALGTSSVANAPWDPETAALALF